MNMCSWQGFRCLYSMGVFNKPVRPGLELMMLLSQPLKGWVSKHGQDSFLFCFSLKLRRLLNNVLSIWLVLFSVL